MGLLLSARCRGRVDVPFLSLGRRRETGLGSVGDGGGHNCSFALPLLFWGCIKCGACWGAKIVEVVIHCDRSQECTKGEVQGGKWPSRVLEGTRFWPPLCGQAFLVPRWPQRAVMVGEGLWMFTGEVAVVSASRPEMFLEAPGKPTPLPAAWHPRVDLSRSSHIRAVSREARQAFSPALEEIPPSQPANRLLFSAGSLSQGLALAGFCFYAPL